MSNLGPIYEDDEHYSPHRANAKGILRDTGTAIVALATTKQIGAVCPTDTSAGLIKNVLYVVDYDTNFNRISFTPVFHTHTHVDNTDESGGRFLDILNANMPEFVEINWVAHQSNPSGFWNIQGTNGVITYTNSGGESYHQIDTLSTTGNTITATMGGARLEFGDTINLLFQSDFLREANLLNRTGINIDRVQDAPSTSRRQMGIEACDGHGTNWVMINANGNSASLVVTPTTINIDDGVDNTYQLYHIPATSLQFFFTGTIAATSTTNIADDGASERQRLFRWGVKLAAGTSNVWQRLYYLRILGNQKIFP